jgi:DNA-binding NarL/FixJ family response regulator
MAQDLLLNVNSNKDILKYQRMHHLNKKNQDDLIDAVFEDAKKYLKEKILSGMNCELVMTYTETGNNAEEQRNEDKIIHVLIGIGKEDLVKKNFPDSAAIRDLKLTDREVELLPYYCTLISDKDIAQRINLEVENIKQFRKGLYKKFNVHDKMKLREKAIDLGLYIDNCLVCAARRRKKK